MAMAVAGGARWLGLIMVLMSGFNTESAKAAKMAATKKRKAHVGSSSSKKKKVSAVAPEAAAAAPPRVTRSGSGSAAGSPDTARPERAPDSVTGHALNRFYKPGLSAEALQAMRKDVDKAQRERQGNKTRSDSKAVRREKKARQQDKAEAYRACHDHAQHHRQTHHKPCGWVKLSTLGMTDGLHEQTYYDHAKRFDEQDKAELRVEYVQRHEGDQAPAPPARNLAGFDLRRVVAQPDELEIVEWVRLMSSFMVVMTRGDFEHQVLACLRARQALNAIEDGRPKMPLSRAGLAAL